MGDVALLLAMVFCEYNVFSTYVWVRAWCMHVCVCMLYSQGLFQGLTQGGTNRDQLPRGGGGLNLIYANNVCVSTCCSYTWNTTSLPLPGEYLSLVSLIGHSLDCKREKVWYHTNTRMWPSHIITHSRSDDPYLDCLLTVSWIRLADWHTIPLCSESAPCCWW